MKRFFALAAATAMVGCSGNAAVGNDREAELDPPSHPAAVVPATAALQGIATGLVAPQIMTGADLAAIPDTPDRCVFRMTRVSEPSVVYGTQAVVKMNDRLVPLPSSGPGTYAADGVTVTIRPLDGDPVSGDPVPAQFVLRLPGASHELGYHGVAEC